MIIFVYKDGLLMNFPAIAKITFDRLRTQSDFAFITNMLITELKEIRFAISRARFFHSKVDEYTKDVFAHPIVKEMSACKKGCSGCCHTEVSVTDDESELLALRVKNGTPIDLERLKNQVQSARARKNFYSLSYENRACVFLDEKGVCGVYTDRPAVCRTNGVLGSSEQCSTQDGAPKSQRLIRTDHADMAIMGAFLISPTSGRLGEMLWEKLHPTDRKVLHPLLEIKKSNDHGL
jgi:Fe-S-cluster containining protein